MEHRYFDALSRLCRLFYNIAANFLPPHTFRDKRFFGYFQESPSRQKSPSGRRREYAAGGAA